jgi:hypothetical protein
MAERHFTPAEANEALAEVRPLAERIVERRKVLAKAMDRRTRLGAVVAGNGGDLDPRTPAEVELAVEQEEIEIAQCVEGIHELGGLVKDLDRGLVDFPSLLEGDEILLCWHVGEVEVAHWHGVDEGFDGRRPLPFPTD